MVNLSNLLHDLQCKLAVPQLRIALFHSHQLQCEQLATQNPDAFQCAMFHKKSQNSFVGDIGGTMNFDLSQLRAYPCNGQKIVVVNGVLTTA